MADNPSPPPNTSKVKKRKKAEQNNTSDDDTDAEFIARYTKIVTDMKKAKIMFPRFLLMMVTSFRRLNTPSTCLPWVASRIGGRRDPGGSTCYQTRYI